MIFKNFESKVSNPAISFFILFVTLNINLTKVDILTLDNEIYCVVVDTLIIFLNVISIPLLF